jgi:hypothetical protein
MNPSLQIIDTPTYSPSAIPPDIQQESPAAPDTSPDAQADAIPAPEHSDTMPTSMENAQSLAEDSQFPYTTEHPPQPRRSTHMTRTNPLMDYRLLNDPSARPRTSRGRDNLQPEGGESDTRSMNQAEEIITSTQDSPDNNSTICVTPHEGLKIVGIIGA